MTALPASTQELLLLPSVPLSARGELPQCPAVYFILDGSTVLYVGKSVNLAQRWVAHHRLRQVESMARYPRIAWMELGEAALLEEVEAGLEAVADNLRTLAAGLTRLEAIQETHLRSYG